MKRKVRIRKWIQLIFFIVAGLIAINHGLAESGKSIPLVGEASLHAICPFGGFVSLYNLFTAGTLVKKIHESSLVLMMIVFISAILLGPIFC
jgi:formate hydrogenlyase subunit 3/multisubunit Na+/H+ antiporter MnhD subunit